MFICIIMCTPYQPLKDSGEREGNGEREREKERRREREKGGGDVLIVS